MALIATVSKVARYTLGAGLVFAALSGSVFAADIPEIDPSSMGSAITLLAGGLALISARRSK